MNYITIKDAEGILRPKALLQDNDKYGKITADKFKLEEGEKLVEVQIRELLK